MVMIGYASRARKALPEYMAATGVTLITKTSKPAVIDKLPPRGSVFVDFLEHVYMGKPASLPLEDIYRVCEVALAASEAALTGKIVRTAWGDRSRIQDIFLANRSFLAFD